MFPPWSVLVFCKFNHPEVGSVIFFDGCDGWSYVRRVSSVKQVPNEGRYVQTIGDIPGAPDDRPLYSADGGVAWSIECPRHPGRWAYSITGHAWNRCHAPRSQ